MLNSRVKIALVVLSIFSSINCLVSQSVYEVNGYIQYVNLSIHGMNEIHRHLHVLNEELLKVQDNPDYKIKRELVSQLPVSLFKDSSFERFENKTPEQVFESIQLATHSDFNRSLKNIKYVCDLTVYELNTIRRFLLKKDIHAGNNFNYIMAKLGQFEKIYEEFFRYRAIMHRVLLEWSYTRTGEKKYVELWERIRSIYVPVSDIVFGVKNVPNYLPDEDLYILHKNFREFLFSRMLIEEDFNFDGIKEILTQKMGYFITDAAKYLELRKPSIGTDNLALQYQYYNTILTRHTNLSYNGFLHDLNEVITRQSFHVPLLLEFPRYFKMSYDRTVNYSQLIEQPSHNFVYVEEDKSSPKKEIAPINKRGIEGPIVTELPETVKERAVSKTEIEMSATDGILKLKFYDHILLDGDRISLNFNGDWILEDHSLEAKPVELELRLNRAGLHYILIHADNVGSKPPNTVGIEYELNGETFKKLLQSDMGTSEMIQIKLHK